MQRNRTRHPFVESSANQLGIGKLVEVQGKVALVEYFRSPTDEEPTRREVPASTLARCMLSPETRAYYRNPKTFITEVGRVLDYQQDDEVYLVRFPNSQTRMIPSDELLVRCRLPISEPTDYLASQLNETAFWHNARSEFVHHLLKQHRISRGLSALLSSSVEIVAHQVSVIHRVLMDPFQRYLLADEVGLGKTIEAGVLIKQFVLDEPDDHETLIIAPSALLVQWKQELLHRFHLGQLINDSIHIVSNRDHNAIAELIPSARMIVIDEAHHLSSWAWSSDHTEESIFLTVRQAVKHLDRRVLLLSATPVLHNERSFLAMLHLLDPQVYAIDRLDLFKKRVRLRQEVAERLMDLREDESNFFLGDALEVLGDLLSEDREFQKLKGELAALIEGDVDEQHPTRTSLIRSIRTHVSDMWCLHRRILRNRRTGATSAYLPGRGGASSAVYECDSETGLAEEIESWRLTISSALSSENDTERIAASGLACSMEELAACEPRRVLEFAEQRLGVRNSGTKDGLALSEEESDSLERIIRAAKNCDQAEKLHTLLQLVGTDDTSDSYVVFTTFPETADLVFEFLNLRLPLGRTLRHSTTRLDWTEFRSGHRGYVLVCDRSAEEGLNLQKRGASAIHFDLPLSPNRVEQRLGRLDRFGSGMPIQSAVLVCAGSRVQKCWFELLNDALGVFRRSIASLQYVIEEAMQNLWRDFIDTGIEGLEDSIAQLGGDEGVVARELKRIRAQDEIDSFEVDLISEEIADDLESKDFGLSRSAPRVFSNWVTRDLHFRRTGEEGGRDEVFSYEFTRRVDVGVRRPFGKDTLLPADEFQRRFAESIDELTPQLPARFVTVPFTFDRVTAQKRSCRLLRVGDPFVDAFEDFTRWDDRGVSYAFWRYIPTYDVIEDPDVYFRFDYVISPNAQPFDKLCQRHGDVSQNALLRRSRAIMEPQFKRIWLDSNLERVVPEDERFQFLNRPYNREPTEYGQDFNLNRDRWNCVAILYDMSLWRDRCFAARRESERLLREESKLPQWSEECVNEATRLASKVQQQYRSRLATSQGETQNLLESDLALEQEILDAQIEAFLKPDLRADSVGAMFISRKMPFANCQNEEEDED